ncbi:hypothetical protein PQX77_014016 [Marasmius sp. AFHP31]|nr:hypothetical protein PQX77_014016 [Marasmius sp. AFHP31]
MTVISPSPPSKVLSLCESASVGRSTCYIRILAQPAASLSLQFALYGAYAVLYGVCISVLRSRRLKLPHYYVHVGAATSLFVLATVSLFLSTLIIVHTAKLSLVGLTFVERDDIVNSVTSQQMLLIPSAHLSLVVANFIADSILIWRCYTVWGYNKQVVAFPTVICFMNNVLGVVTNALYIKHRRPEQFFQIPHTDPTSTLFTTFIFATLFSNVFITVLIAGRIFYLGRTSKALLEPDYQRMYKTAIAITLESGVILPFAIIIYAAATLNSQIENVSGPHPEMAPGDRFEIMETMAEVMFYSLVQFVGIAPTLIIVRIGLGITIEDPHPQPPQLSPPPLSPSTSVLPRYQTQSRTREEEYQMDEMRRVSREERMGSDSQSDGRPYPYPQQRTPHPHSYSQSGSDSQTQMHDHPV